MSNAILPSIRFEAVIQRLEDEEKAATKTLNKKARELLLLRHDIALLRGHALPLVRTYEVSVQLELPGLPEKDCAHTSWSPNRAGKVACLDCGDEIDLQPPADDDRGPSMEGPSASTPPKTKLDKKSGERIRRGPGRNAGERELQTV